MDPAAEGRSSRRVAAECSEQTKAGPESGERLRKKDKNTEIIGKSRAVVWLFFCVNRLLFSSWDV